jgi:hypothetical protein
MSQFQANSEESSRLFLSLLLEPSIARLPRSDLDEIRLYIDHREFEVALNYLVGVIRDERPHLTGREVDQIRDLATRFHLDPAKLVDLSPHHG